MTLLKDIKMITNQQPMPTNDSAVSASIKSVTGETVSLYYSSSGVRTIDAGQAAGTAVMGQLANKNILDANGGYIATTADSSLSFTGNCFTNQVKFPRLGYYEVKDGTWAAKLAAVTARMANGDYCVDYESGTIYGVKATTTSSLTSTAYSCNQAQSITVDSEFPTAAALNGTWAKTTVTTISGAALMANDGTNEVLVSSGAGTVATAARVTLGSDDPAVTALQLIDNAVSGAGFNVTQLAGVNVNLGAGASNTGTQRVTEGSTSMLAKGTEDAAGADTYTTVITPATACTHVIISLGGTNDAIISFDGGVTDQLVVPASSIVVLDAITIAAGVAIQGKNKTSGSNYTNLNISAW